MELTVQETKETVLHEPGFVTVWQTDRCIFVYRSPLVTEGCELHRKIEILLDNRRKSWTLTFEDDDMMFGEGILDAYRLH